MTTHIMLDLETWGKRPGCDIRSIGAVVFDPHTGFVAGADAPALPQNQFYVATDNPIIYEAPWTPPQGGSEIKPWHYKYKLIRDPETVQWWNDQSPEAQAAFANPVDLRDACIKFAEWLSITANYDGWAAEHGTGQHVRLWANGPQFDCSILEAVFHAVGLPVPWHYRAPRDFRTITDAAGMTREEYCNYGTDHNALDDAIAQAMTICEAYKRLRINLENN